MSAPRPPAIAGVTLDATGTLFAARGLGAEYAAVLARHGIELDPGELDRRVAEVWSELSCRADPRRDRFAAHPGGALGFWRAALDRLSALAGAPRASAFAAAELYERFAGAAPWRRFDDVEPALAGLRTLGLRIGVVANWDERLPRLLAALGFGDRFDAVVYSQAVGVEKPHPAIFAAAERALGLTAAQILHVGDRRLEDVEGAHGAGWRALLVARDGGGDLESLAELPTRVAALA
jgi:putative hydrolase of the HAD superfamily